jgi:hypothetical protein
MSEIHGLHSGHTLPSSALFVLSFGCTRCIEISPPLGLPALSTFFAYTRIPSTRKNKASQNHAREAKRSNTDLGIYSAGALSPRIWISWHEPDPSVSKGLSYSIHHLSQASTMENKASLPTGFAFLIHYSSSFILLDFSVRF